MGNRVVNFPAGAIPVGYIPSGYIKRYAWGEVAPDDGSSPRVSRVLALNLKYTP